MSDKTSFHPKNLFSSILVLMLGLLYVFSPSLTAEAHSSLLEMTPAEKVVVEKSPPVLKLRFNEPVEQDLASVTIYDWNAKPVFSGKPDSGKERSALLKFSLPKLKQGSYTVKWHVISLDGHPVGGSYTFAVGEATKNGIKSVGNTDDSVTPLIVSRSIVQGLLLISAGLYIFSWLAARKQYPSLGKLFKKRNIIFPILFIGTIIELAAYAISLPSGLIQTLLSGRWELLKQFPFILMLFAQLLVLLLLVIPGMVRTWYVALWLILAAIPAFGGHVWGMEYTIAALIPRIIHELSIAVWLGALCYVLLLTVWNRKEAQDDVPWQLFRPFFVNKMLVMAGLVVLSGISMVYMQTGWTALIKDWMPWNALLVVKIALTLLMLILAAYQTLKWKSRRVFTTNKLVRTEWIIGLIVIVLGVWMSQSAYPIPIKTYEKTLVSHQMDAHVHIEKLQAGDRKMTVNLPKSGGQDAEHVTAEITMPEHDMDSGQLMPKKSQSGRYHTKLPFTMAGTWHIHIQATYPDGTQLNWSDKLFIMGVK
ncbi:copper resistance protein CopC [Virgibacillus halophilus]|uniref:copper resistance protein CopC n=1 Tax=Tigheibacillus halophilus TaxID=361280 RepID=UPI00362E7D4A